MNQLEYIMRIISNDEVMTRLYITNPIFHNIVECLIHTTLTYENVLGLLKISCKEQDRLANRVIELEKNV